MYSFESVSAAQDFIRDEVDVALPEREGSLANGMAFSSYARILPEGRFTNVYDMSFDPERMSAGVYASETLQSVYDYVSKNPQISAAMSGGFFFLADRYSMAPRQHALNLAVSDGNVRSLPVVDREAVVIRNGEITAQKVRALGEMTLEGIDLTWAGALTSHEADCTVYGNGNARIVHRQDEHAGTIRVLDEVSRLTPQLSPDDERVDVGFMARPDGSFRGADYNLQGQMDIFAYDIVARLPLSYLKRLDSAKLHIQSIDSVKVSPSLQGALSVGPLLDETDFTGHPVNTDASLGSKPPFVERAMARAVLFETAGGAVHMRLFDGRPGSETFTGVTPSEAVALIREEAEIVWGCFLDPGQTAKMAVRRDSDIKSYGNRHYLKWPTEADPRYLWVPDSGRPLASLITLQ